MYSFCTLLLLSLIITRAVRVVLFSVASVCVFFSVCLSVNMITSELLEILSPNFWEFLEFFGASKGRTSSKMVI